MALVFGKEILDGKASCERRGPTIPSHRRGRWGSRGEDRRVGEDRQSGGQGGTPEPVFEASIEGDRFGAAVHTGLSSHESCLEEGIGLGSRGYRVAGSEQETENEADELAVGKRTCHTNVVSAKYTIQPVLRSL